MRLCALIRVAQQNSTETQSKHVCRRRNLPLEARGVQEQGRERRRAQSSRCHSQAFTESFLRLLNNVSKRDLLRRGLHSAWNTEDTRFSRAIHVVLHPSLIPPPTHPLLDTRSTHTFRPIGDRCDPTFFPSKCKWGTAQRQQPWRRSDSAGGSTHHDLADVEPRCCSGVNRAWVRNCARIATVDDSGTQEPHLVQ